MTGRGAGARGAASSTSPASSSRPTLAPRSLAAVAAAMNAWAFATSPDAHSALYHAAVAADFGSGSAAYALARHHQRLPPPRHHRPRLQTGERRKIGLTCTSAAALSFRSVIFAACFEVLYSMYRTIGIIHINANGVRKNGTMAPSYLEGLVTGSKAAAPTAAAPAAAARAATEHPLAGLVVAAHALRAVLAQPQTSPGDANRMAVVWGVRWYEAAAGRMGGGKERPMFCRPARIRSAVSKSRLATGRNVISCRPRSTVYGEP